MAEETGYDKNSNMTQSTNAAMELETCNLKNNGKLFESKKKTEVVVQPKVASYQCQIDKGNDLESHLRMFMAMIANINQGQNLLNHPGANVASFLPRSLPELLKGNSSDDLKKGNSIKEAFEIHEEELKSISNVNKQVIEKVRQLDTDIDRLMKYGRECMEPWRTEISDLSIVPSKRCVTSIRRIIY